MRLEKNQIEEKIEKLDYLIEEGNYRKALKFFKENCLNRRYYLRFKRIIENRLAIKNKFGNKKIINYIFFLLNKKDNIKIKKIGEYIVIYEKVDLRSLNLFSRSEDSAGIAKFIRGSCIDRYREVIIQKYLKENEIPLDRIFSVNDFSRERDLVGPANRYLISFIKRTLKELLKEYYKYKGENSLVKIKGIIGVDHDTGKFFFNTLNKYLLSEPKDEKEIRKVLGFDYHYEETNGENYENIRIRVQGDVKIIFITLKKEEFLKKAYKIVINISDSLDNNLIILKPCKELRYSSKRPPGKTSDEETSFEKLINTLIVEEIVEEIGKLLKLIALNKDEIKIEINLKDISEKIKDKIKFLIKNGIDLWLEYLIELNYRRKSYRRKPTLIKKIIKEEVLKYMLNKYKKTIIHFVCENEKDYNIEYFNHEIKLKGIKIHESQDSVSFLILRDQIIEISHAEHGKKQIPIKGMCLIKIERMNFRRRLLIINDDFKQFIRMYGENNNMDSMKKMLYNTYCNESFKKLVQNFNVNWQETDLIIDELLFEFLEETFAKLERENAMISTFFEFFNKEINRDSWDFRTLGPCSQPKIPINLINQLNKYFKLDQNSKSSG